MCELFVELLDAEVIIDLIRTHGKMKESPIP